MNFYKKRDYFEAVPARRLGKHPNAKVYVYRRVVFTAVVVLTFAFIAKIVLSFFGAAYVSLQLSGNVHYTEVQIYDILAEQLDNIVIDSEARTEAYLKENLSYIKEANVSKHVMKRLLTIEITEREPFVLLKFYEGFKIPPDPDDSDAAAVVGCALFLLDVDAHVLERIPVGETGEPVAERLLEMGVIVGAGNALPKVGTAVQISGVPLAAEVLKIAARQQPELASQIESLDASRSQQIKMRIEPLPMPVWIAEDAIETGLHHVMLLLKQQRTEILALLKGQLESKRKPYIDARFEDSIYLGGSTETQ